MWHSLFLCQYFDILSECTERGFWWVVCKNKNGVGNLMYRLVEMNLSSSNSFWPKEQNNWHVQHTHVKLMMSQEITSVCVIDKHPIQKCNSYMYYMEPQYMKIFATCKEPPLFFLFLCSHLEPEKPEWKTQKLYLWLFILVP